MKSITYLGSADDRVKLYPWKLGTDRRNLQDQLIHATIYDQRIALNDGYLIANSELQDNLGNLNGSVVGSAIRSKSVQVFCRGEPTNLVEGFEERSAKVNTHSLTFNDKEKWPVIRENFEILQEDVGHSAIQWPEDKNMGQLFYKAMACLHEENRLPDAVDEKHRKNFDKVYRCFDDAIDKSRFDGARGLWETLSWEVLHRTKVDPRAESLAHIKGYKDVLPLMQVANEAYHMAYSCALDHVVDQREKLKLDAARPLTACCPAYKYLFAYETAEKRDELRVDGLDQLLITIGKVDFKEDCHYGWLQDLRYDSNLRKLRAEYTEMLQLFTRGKFDLKDALELRDNYVAKLAELMLPQVKEPFQLQTLLLKMAGGDLVDSVAKTVLEKLAIAYGEDRLGKPIFEKLVAIPNIENQLIYEGIISHQDLPPGTLARDLGLIHVNLDRDKVRGFTADIQPHPLSSGVHKSSGSAEDQFYEVGGKEKKE